MECNSKDEDNFQYSRHSATDFLRIEKDFKLAERK